MKVVSTNHDLNRHFVFKKCVWELNEAHTHTCARSHVHTYTHTYTHTHTRAHTHTHTHAHTHTQTVIMENFVLLSDSAETLF